MTVLIEAVGLQKQFGDIKAVGGISMRVTKGEVLGFLGPNGAGKSTTMKMITGFLEPDQAILHDPQVLIMDEPTDGLDPNQKHHVRQLIADMAARQGDHRFDPHSRRGRGGVLARRHHQQRPRSSPMARPTI